MKRNELFSKLPSVDVILGNKCIVDILKQHPRPIVLEAIREVIDIKRSEIKRLEDEEISLFNIDIEDIVNKSIEKIKVMNSLSLKKVINATGTVIHTNLGRSLLSNNIKEDLWTLSSRYSNLEYDIENGQRGSRYDHLIDIIKKLTNAEDVLVVNNNAAAVLLVLDTIAKEKDVIVSRGELVEVGGSFRIPDIMKLSGARLVEVGATNKTHLKDYKDELKSESSVLMKVHTSNYKIMGFTESVMVEELSKLSKEYNIPLIEDLGSGVFVDLSKYGLPYEPTVLDSINKGVDIVTFSGDKLLGGPQAGIIVGKKEYIEKMKVNQLTRALRVDKMTICALEATLNMYLDEDKAIKNIPTLKMLTYSIKELEGKANNLLEKIKKAKLDIDIEIEDGLSQVGGGSMPIHAMNTKVLSIIPRNISVSKLEKELRLSDSHIIAKIYDDKYILDVRTIFEDEFEDIVKELERAIK